MEKKIEIIGYNNETRLTISNYQFEKLKKYAKNIQDDLGIQVEIKNFHVTSVSK